VVNITRTGGSLLVDLDYFGELDSDVIKTASELILTNSFSTLFGARSVVVESASKCAACDCEDGDAVATSLRQLHASPSGVISPNWAHVSGGTLLQNVPAGSVLGGHAGEAEGGGAGGVTRGLCLPSGSLHTVSEQRLPRRAHAPGWVRHFGGSSLERRQQRPLLRLYCWSHVRTLRTRSHAIKTQVHSNTVIPCVVKCTATL
jgi:hypothetical protein